MGRYTRVNRRWIFHRLVLKLRSNNRKVVDHIDKNKLDNRKINLRICYQVKNTYNSPMKKNNSSGFTGVFFSKDKNKYYANIMIKGKNIFLGYFENIEDAIKKRLEGEAKYFAEYSPQIHLFEKYGVKI
jgi:hypothetical protein